ncbi:uncharacterized protein LOC134557824 [Prinia subflava]|uniref:uncharacterized protein LOC134557824 n=1 Tax=Prinia subflava TaxID=208062 RepID=UPI002FE3A93B
MARDGRKTSSRARRCPPPAWRFRQRGVPPGAETWPRSPRLSEGRTALVPPRRRVELKSSPALGPVSQPPDPSGNEKPAPEVCGRAGASGAEPSPPGAEPSRCRALPVPSPPGAEPCRCRALPVPCPCRALPVPSPPGAVPVPSPPGAEPSRCRALPVPCPPGAEPVPSPPGAVPVLASRSPAAPSAILPVCLSAALCLSAASGACGNRARDRVKGAKQGGSAAGPPLPGPVYLSGLPGRDLGGPGRVPASALMPEEQHPFVCMSGRLRARSFLPSPVCWDCWLDPAVWGES